MIISLVTSVLSLILAVYYISVTLHIIGIIKLTNKKFSWKALLPFYYWINK